MRTRSAFISSLGHVYVLFIRVGAEFIAYGNEKSIQHRSQTSGTGGDGGSPEQETGSGQLEVNVVVTNPEATTLALTFAVALAVDFNAYGRLRAAIVMPWRLPLHNSRVAIRVLLVKG